jgi:glycosyltransferase involved in cell wall biosynthesis
MRSYRPHVIHTHLSKAGLLGRVAGIFASSAARVHTFHGNVFDGYFSPRMTRAILAVERTLGARTDAVVALSEMQRAELIDYGITSPDRIRVIPLGINLDRFGEIERAQARRELGIDPEVVVAVAVGRMVPIKRLDRMVRAFSVCVADNPHARLHLVGDGPERPGIESLVKSLGIADKVTFVGWSAETERWYGAADVVVLSSEREGTPLALIEAAAAGRAVVATGVGGVPDVVDNGVTGLVVPNGEESALAEGLDMLLRDAAARERMGHAALQRSGRFGASRLVDDLEHLYEDLIERRAR